MNVCGPVLMVGCGAKHVDRLFDFAATDVAVLQAQLAQVSTLRRPPPRTMRADGAHIAPRWLDTALAPGCERRPARRLQSPSCVIVRRKRGHGFSYIDERGRAVRDRATLARIRALAIPPAWTDVEIAADATAKIQATGRDAKRRKQYRYHAQFRRRAEAKKYTRLVAFCRVLPAVRRAVDRDLRCDCMCKRKVAAAIVALLECAHLRVGNEEYARTNGAYGATTLRDRHVRVDHDRIALHYRGKSGVTRDVEIVDRTLAAIVARCRALPGAQLFQYRDDDRDHALHPVRSHDVNAYLREVSRGEFTAKDFRTWAATVGAAQLLAAADGGHDRNRKRSALAAIAAVASRLGHTKTVCRASYIHPRIVEDYIAGAPPWQELASAIQRSARKVERGRRAQDPFAVAYLRAAERKVADYLAAA